jgi:signal transduction histidine kinase
LQDTGPGVAPEQIKDIFKRFYRVQPTNGKVRGTGLGLYICRQIITAHHGKIFAESELGQGLTIHIHLPCSDSFNEATKQGQEVSI